MNRHNQSVDHTLTRRSFIAAAATTAAIGGLSTGAPALET
ncbi:MAG: twin-arginine translocation signal domain-containing protein [Phycisphaerales bacterium]|nr:twin-arginine translocation signal domain-containing protein [Phycisphaerales bacterium]